ncbi:MAG TPA: F0F1 ATP synthase subunit A [Candidatus Desulfovibrio intestinipullorum]|uniref:ATP synthase subunit a n=1 Tax=Candidatus Desulfovibrio intestinipullorum TaxID=2838536 RepID=A0A9D1PWQ6_9BACT|nr:F0F1 ATP synthase subunit A [Candidatus Desulfovibrio intestinipullorum]
MDTIEIGGKTIEFQHVFYSWLCMAILFVAAWLCRRRLTMVPGTLQNFWEAIIETLENFICSTLGDKHGPKWVPLLAGLFIYLLGSNLMGLIPGFNAPTANLNTTVSMALFVFVLYNIVGIYIWHHNYIKQFLGVSKWLIPLMLPLEIVSHISRPVSLSLRLFGNIRGEEIVLILFFIMAPVIATIPVYALFLLAKFMQALVFFLLTMFYLKGAIEGPEH